MVSLRSSRSTRLSASPKPESASDMNEFEEEQDDPKSSEAFEDSDYEDRNQDQSNNDADFTREDSSDIRSQSNQAPEIAKPTPTLDYSSSLRPTRRPRASYAVPLSDEEEEVVPRPKKRGRPPKRKEPFLTSDQSPYTSASYPSFTKHDNYEVRNDEYVIDTIDPAGERKVDMYGNLKGKREYKCRTFTSKGRGNRLYMISTEPARLMGYRDSYMLFVKHRRLYKVSIYEDEKWDLIERGIIPWSCKSRIVSLISARSVFREFGAKIIVGGRKVTDDYWESDARARGDREGELAEIDDRLPPPGMPYARQAYASSSSLVGSPLPIYDRSLAPYMNSDHAIIRKRKLLEMADPTWMLEHAKATSNYNSTLAQERKDKWYQGFYEPHTNLLLLPQDTQPQKVWWVQVQSSDDCPIPKLDTKLTSHFLDFPSVNLLDVSDDILEGVSAEVLDAIKDRQKQEKQYRDRREATLFQNIN